MIFPILQQCVVGGCNATFASQGGLARHVPTHFSQQNSSKMSSQAKVKEESPSKAGINKRRKLKNKRRRSLRMSPSLCLSFPLSVFPSVCPPPPQPSSLGRFCSSVCLHPLACFWFSLFLKIKRFLLVFLRSCDSSLLMDLLGLLLTQCNLSAQIQEGAQISSLSEIDDLPSY